MVVQLTSFQKIYILFNLLDSTAIICIGILMLKEVRKMSRKLGDRLED